MTETNFDFKDGNGLVKAHKHENGGGWVADTATVTKTAQVYGNAQVSGNAQVYGNANVSGNARVYGNAQVTGNAQVYGNAQVSDNAQVYGNANVSGNARVYGNARVEKSPINIIGIEYNITIYADFAQVGCKLYKIEEWKKFSASDVDAMDGVRATNFYPKLLAIFSALGL